MDSRIEHDHSHATESKSRKHGHSWNSLQPARKQAKFNQPQVPVAEYPTTIAHAIPMSHLAIEDPMHAATFKLRKHNRSWVPSQPAGKRTKLHRQEVSAHEVMVEVNHPESRPPAPSRSEEVCIEGSAVILRNEYDQDGQPLGPVTSATVDTSLLDGNTSTARETSSSECSTNSHITIRTAESMNVPPVRHQGDARIPVIAENHISEANDFTPSTQRRVHTQHSKDATVDIYGAISCCVTGSMEGEYVDYMDAQGAKGSTFGDAGASQIMSRSMDKVDHRDGGTETCDAAEGNDRSEVQQPFVVDDDDQALRNGTDDGLLTVDGSTLQNSSQPRYETCTEEQIASIPSMLCNFSSPIESCEESSPPDRPGIPLAPIIDMRRSGQRNPPATSAVTSYLGTSEQGCLLEGLSTSTYVDARGEGEDAAVDPKADAETSVSGGWRGIPSAASAITTRLITLEQDGVAAEVITNSFGDWQGIPLRLSTTPSPSEALHESVPHGLVIPEHTDTHAKENSDVVGPITDTSVGWQGIRDLDIIELCSQKPQDVTRGERQLLHNNSRGRITADATEVPTIQASGNHERSAGHSHTLPMRVIQREGISLPRFPGWAGVPLREESIDALRHTSTGFEIVNEYTESRGGIEVVEATAWSGITSLLPDRTTGIRHHFLRDESFGQAKDADICEHQPDTVSIQIDKSVQLPVMVERGPQSSSCATQAGQREEWLKSKIATSMVTDQYTDVFSGFGDWTGFQISDVHIQGPDSDDSNSMTRQASLACTLNRADISERNALLDLCVQSSDTTFMEIDVDQIEAQLCSMDECGSLPPPAVYPPTQTIFTSVPEPKSHDSRHTVRLEESPMDITSTGSAWSPFRAAFLVPNSTLDPVNFHDPTRGYSDGEWTGLPYSAMDIGTSARLHIPSGLDPMTVMADRWRESRHVDGGYLDHSWAGVPIQTTNESQPDISGGRTEWSEWIPSDVQMLHEGDGNQANDEDDLDGTCMASSSMLHRPIVEQITGPLRKYGISQTEVNNDLSDGEKELDTIMAGWHRQAPNAPATKKDVQTMLRIVLDRIGTKAHAKHNPTQVLEGETLDKEKPVHAGVRHRKLRTLELQAKLRMYLCCLLGRDSVDSPIPVATEAEVQAFEKKMHTGPTKVDYRLHLTGSLHSKWNNQAATVFTDDFVSKGLAGSQGKQKLRAMFFVHLATLRTQYTKQQRGEEEPTQIEIDRQIEMNREQRRRALWIRRSTAVATHSDLARFQQLWDTIPYTAMSGDESDHSRGQVRYVVTKLPWRSYDFETWLRVFDSMHLSRRFRTDGKPKRGAFPHHRRRGAKRLEQRGEPVRHLPMNCYNPLWLATLSDNEVSALNMQPSIDLNHTDAVLAIETRFRDIRDGTTSRIRPLTQQE